MRGMVGVLVLTVVQLAPRHTFAAGATQPVVIQDGVAGSPRVVAMSARFTKGTDTVVQSA